MEPSNLKDLAEFVADLKEDTLEKRVVTVEGVEHFCRDKFLVDIDTDLAISKIRHPQPIKAATLQAVAGIFHVDASFDTQDVFVHVSGPQSVSVQGIKPLADGCRDTLIESEYPPPQHYFGQYLAVDTFMAWLLSGFVPNDDSRKLAALLGRGVKIEAARQVSDDGASTQLKRTRGVTAEWTDDVKPHFVLKPRRTFPEVEQPDCLCTFRVLANNEEDDVKIKLVESDGGGWKFAAITAIGDYLGRLIEGVPILK